ncbi:RICIN domain-containing protein [Streptomyces sp. NBC_00878]|uniref:RICIN domain-containing protein n=1 Tax=Streptomyces sp. NBC_00878 TaxID=2975854 RepID=UPI002252490D|nr:RICIN domain-containing protein [Streptomyces sp. NBC_00878]MCX4909094.1 RICIN domain-containing protein [Streptomyces sp. NBC_00878]
MIRKAISGLVAALAVIAATLLGTASPAVAEVSGPWVMQPYTSDLCIHPTNYSSASGVVVEQTLCESRVDRDWNFQTINAGYYRISYRNGGKCLAVSGSSTANSAKIVTQACGNPTLNDNWLPIRNFSAGDLDYYLLYNRHSGKCLNVKGNSTAIGGDLIQYTCNTAANNESFTWNRP